MQRVIFAPTEIAALTERIIGYFTTDAEEKKISPPPYVKVPFAITAKNANGAVAGRCAGYTVWNETHVDLLARNPEVDTRGAGSALLKEVERIARRNQSDRVDLETMSWQARPFYERRGFRHFGSIHNHPRGHTKYFLEKMLMDGAAAGGAAMDAGKAADAASALTIVPSDHELSVKEIIQWMNEDIRAKKVPGVDDYVKTEYGVNIMLPDGSLGGGCVYNTAWNELHVSLLGIMPERKGQGIGGAVMRQLVETAKKHRCDFISLETMSWQARPFYLRHGFRQFGEQKNIPHGFDRYFLERRLD